MKKFNLLWVIILILGTAVLMAGCASQAKPLVFGVVADVQYADKDAAGGRYYRASLGGLVAFVQECNQRHVDFAIQLGDLIDGGDHAGVELDHAATVYDQLNCRHYCVLGNHDFAGISRSKVLKRLGLDRGYYSFEQGGILFVVLDTQDTAVQGGWAKNSAQYKKAEELLQKAMEDKSPNAQSYNGGLGSEQMVWLDGVLAGAKKKNQDVIVFGHLPLWPDGDKHTAWNAGDVRKILAEYGCVKAYLCGHNHAGGYGQENGIHYLNLQGAVDDPDGRTWAVITMRPDRMDIQGTGNVKNQTLMFKGKK
jgi:manganese-dependent ADP-ribose/CDP-alcohol diphosphatase